MRCVKLCGEFWRHDYDASEGFNRCRRCGALGENAPTEARFWRKVNKDGPVPAKRPELGNCWVWTGAVFTNGYGQFAWDGFRSARAHRYAFGLPARAIPGDPEPDHLCKVRLCVRPSHMELVTHQENIRRAKCLSSRG